MPVRPVGVPEWPVRRYPGQHRKRRYRGLEKKLWEADAGPFEEKMKRLTATLREQRAEAAKLDASIEPLGSRIQTWLPFPTTLAP